MTNIKIRKMHFADLDRVMEIEREVYTDPWREEMFYQEIEADSSYVLEETKTKEIIGFFCGIQVLDEYSLMNIAIGKDYQNKGYGTYLLNYLITLLIRKRCKNCFLEARESNLRAIKIYSEIGFKPIIKRKGYYQNPKEDAIVMKLELTKSLQDIEDSIELSAP